MPITDPVWTSPNHKHEDFIRPMFGAKRKADHSAELMHDDESNTLYMVHILLIILLYNRETGMEFSPAANPITPTYFCKMNHIFYNVSPKLILFKD